MIRIAAATAALALAALLPAGPAAAASGDFAKAFETSCATKSARENTPMDCGCQVQVMKQVLGEEQAERLFEITWLDHYAERNETNAARKHDVSEEMGGMDALTKILEAGRKARTDCAL